MGLTARILAQGDEICTGATLDTNSQWLAAELSARGVTIRGLGAAPDDCEQLTTLFRAAGEDCDLICSTGGLGPTDDDLSAAAAAAAAGVPYAMNAEARAQIAARFAAMNRAMPAVNLRQAELPAGAQVLENPIGTAPGFAVTIGRARAWFFPGVPREFKLMAAQHLWPWLESQGLTPGLRRKLHVCNVGESALQTKLDAMAPLPDGVRLGFKTWMPYNSIVLYGRDAGALDAAADQVASTLAGDVFGQDDTTFPQALGAALLAKGWTLALAESCTGGGAGALVTDAPGSSAWFLGSIVSYANAVKEHTLGVSADLLVREGAVSEPVAAAMAAGARRLTGADCAVSITGVAGPGGGTETKPVGTVCFGLATPEGAWSRTVQFGDRGREVVRILAAAAALEWLRRRLVG